MRTVIQAPVWLRCGHCTLPDALHTKEQKALCERRLLADLARSLPRSVKSPEERRQEEAKRLQSAVQSLSHVLRSVPMNSDERATLQQALDVSNSLLAQRGAQ